MNLVTGARARSTRSASPHSLRSPRTRECREVGAEQITSVKGMNQKGMNLEIVNSKNCKDIWNYSDKSNHLVVMNLVIHDPRNL